MTFVYESTLHFHHDPVCPGMQTTFNKSFRATLIAATLCFVTVPALAVDAPAPTDTISPATVRELQELLANQKAQLEAQEQELASQVLKIQAQQKVLQSVQKQLEALTADQDENGSPDASGTVAEVGESTDKKPVDQDAAARNDDAAAAPESLDMDDTPASKDPAPGDAGDRVVSLSDPTDSGHEGDGVAEATDADADARIDDAAAAPESLDLGDEPSESDETAEKKPLQVVVAPEPLSLGSDFDNAIRLPDGTSALKIGGYVKMSLVDSFDPIGSDDRFVTASIPVGVTDDYNSSGQFSVTARQSRLNFDLRQKTSYGTFRAFVEGDFAANNDTYRLRHAFGQYKQFLAGKTYSTFVDSTSTPEEIDFEGINGRINVRQALVRYFPRIGRDANFLVGLEDPAPDVTDGIAVSKIPDTVISWRRVLRARWHIKTSVLLRQLEAQWDVDPAVSDTAFGWGVSVSGNTAFGKWNTRDKVMFQLNYGDGFGRYVSDLRAEGGQDGIFNPDTGNLETFKVFAGYVSFQHWWQEKIRSSLTYSWVSVDNFEFQDDSAYEKSRRASLNVIWSPIQRVDIGSEIIWGERINMNDDSASALQAQFSVKYKF